MPKERRGAGRPPPLRHVKEIAVRHIDPRHGQSMSEQLTSFRIDVSERELEDLRDRLRRTRWPEPATVTDWSQGVPLDYLQEVCRHWLEHYQWRACEARLNAFPQFRTHIDGLDIHFLHVRSPEPNALPVVLTHGWPGSVVEFLDVIGPLTDPVAHGGNADDALHLVVPSLPGFGFSDKPAGTGWGRERIADAWVVLMERLGYPRFGAQGGDWGASVCNYLALRHPQRLVGIHLNLVSVQSDPGQADFTLEEKAALAEARKVGERHMKWESGYIQQQSSRPQTLGYGLTDSPVGQCAWILEKFRAWTDCGGDPVTAFGVDRLLDNISLYWLTASATSSARLYWESRPSSFSTRVEVPVGVSIFPKELGRPFRGWATRVYPDLRYWNEVERGGHFAAFEQPDLFVREVRNFFRSVV
jgi:pimeloyl-ACP methyl ester carboxylesterase